MKNLESKVSVSDIDIAVSAAYDYDFDGVTSTEIKMIDKSMIPESFGIGLIIGQSGSGKTTNLLEFGAVEEPVWDDSISVASNFGSFESASSRLHGCGLNSIKCWTQKYSTLSTGQKYRADMAMRVCENAVFDEFASYVDANTAKSLSNSIRRYVDSCGIKGVVLATCRDDVIEWLRPDWIFNAETGELSVGRLERRPPINIEIHPCTVQVWERFKAHHYLSADINKGSRCWVATWDGSIVGFYATLAQPSGTMSNAWRGTRMVVLPEFQGLGISSALCESVASIHLESGKRFFAKTASYLLGEHRESSKKWRPTSKNKMKRKDYKSGRCNKFSESHKARHADRFTYSHEFIGPNNDQTT